MIMCSSVSCSTRVRSVWLVLVALVFALAGQIGADAQSAPAMPSQTSSQDGVVVKVTPNAIGPGAAEWKFAVALDTHSQELGDDLANTAVLVLDGSERKPTDWNGASPGGHHRDGTLTFAAPAEAPKLIELRIQRPNEAAPRVFRWESAALR